MTARITLGDGTVVVLIEATPPQECAYCHEERECRPYSLDGAPICYDCAMLPGHRAVADARIKEMLR